jgi:uncharacterized membrane protein YcgQ (UPF0703/DUF1980 family)
VAHKYVFQLIEVKLTNEIVGIYSVQCDILIYITHYSMITIIKFINLYIISFSCIFGIGWEHLRSTLSKFQVYKTVLLTIVTVLFIRAPELTHPVYWDFVLFNHCVPFPLSLPQSWKPLLRCLFYIFYLTYPATIANIINH